MIAVNKAKLICLIVVTLVCTSVVDCGLAFGQQIQVSQPLNRLSDSYFGRLGVNFGFQLNGGRGPGSRVVGLSPTGQIQPNIVFSQNGVSSAVPQFGGYDPNTQGYVGFGTLGDNGGFTLQLFGGQGSTRSNVSQTPSVVVPNGGVGSIFSGRVRPFVTGIVPVLGAGGFGPQVVPPPMIRGGNPFLSDGQNPPPSRSAHTMDEPKTYSDPQSTAIRGDISVDEIRRQRELAMSRKSAELMAEINELVKNADEMVDQEKFGAARAKYSRAIRKIGNNSQLADLRAAIAKKLSAIELRRR